MLADLLLPDTFSQLDDETRRLLEESIEQYKPQTIHELRDHLELDPDCVFNGYHRFCKASDEFLELWTQRSEDFAAAIYPELQTLKDFVAGLPGGNRPPPSDFPPGHGRSFAQVANRQVAIGLIRGAGRAMGYKTVSLRKADDYNEEIDSDILLDTILHDQMRQFILLQYNLDYWQEMVHETTRQQIAALQQTSLENGWSNEEFAANIREDSGGLFTMGRARRIARTETTSSLGAGAWMARDRMLSNGAIIGERWLGILDNSIRNAHRSAHHQQVVKRNGIWVVEKNGEQIATGRAFVIGDERARFPGDPQLSAKNRVFCRCDTDSVLGEM